MYIWQLANWTNWDYDSECLNLEAIRTKQASLFNKMISIGFDVQNETLLSILTEDVVKTSAIEGELYNPTQVRSSIAFRLGIDIGSIAPVNRNIDGVVEMTLDAIHNYEKPLTLEKLFAWHYALFPYGRSGLYSITVGKFRDDSNGSMQVVSGSFGREKIHYEAPPADRLEKEMSIFLDWYNNKEMDYIIKAAIAHLWFVTIHPFDDGNGRIARAITDMQLAKGEKNSLRFYSLSSQIEQHRNSYYEILERQKDSMDITSYLQWFVSMLDNALISTEHVFERIILKSKFWSKYNQEDFNERQTKMLNLFFDNFKGKLTIEKWAKINKCTGNEALVDIQKLLKLDILNTENNNGKINYVFKFDNEEKEPEIFSPNF